MRSLDIVSISTKFLLHSQFFLQQCLWMWHVQSTINVLHDDQSELDRCPKKSNMGYQKFSVLVISSYSYTERVTYIILYLLLNRWSIGRSFRLQSPLFSLYLTFRLPLSSIAMVWLLEIQPIARSLQVRTTESFEKTRLILFRIRMSITLHWIW